MASIELVLDWDIRNARLEFLPWRLAVIVVHKESRKVFWETGG